jgi:hypothetical protein
MEEDSKAAPSSLAQSIQRLEARLHEHINASSAKYQAILAEIAKGPATIAKIDSFQQNISLLHTLWRPATMYAAILHHICLFPRYGH